MGAAASVERRAVAAMTAMTAADISAYVGSINEGKFACYSDAFLAEGVDGKLLLSLSKDRVMQILPSLGVSNPLHQAQLAQHLVSMREETAAAALPATSNPQDAAAASQEQNMQQDKLARCFHETVLIPPCDILEQIFKIQGIALDPSEMEPCVAKIVKMIRACNGGLGGLSSADVTHGAEGQLAREGGAGHVSVSPLPGADVHSSHNHEHYDCFINYRVSSDKDVAEKLYYQLKLLGLNPFFDKFCLKPGFDWKAGFMEGLNRSRTFIALMSARGLEPCRDFAKNHSHDNVLLEYQTALFLNKATGTDSEDFILPVLVGELEGNSLHKFCDFNKALYSDRVIPESALKAAGSIKALEVSVAATLVLARKASTKASKAHSEASFHQFASSSQRAIQLERTPELGAAAAAAAAPNTAGKDTIIEYDTGTYVGGTDESGRMHGVGTFTYSSGDVYSGDFVHDVKSGSGTFKNAGGDCYSGEWSADAANGIGTFVWANGNSYTGAWLDNQKHGLGEFTWPDGEKYTGDFVAGSRDGKCVIAYPDGSTYTGEIRNGLKSGYGRAVYFDDGDTDICEYEGLYANDQETVGKMLFIDGSVYEGEFKNGLQHGHGKYTYNNGDIYDGAWQDDVKHGQGRFIQAGVVKYEGQWANDKRQQ